MNRLNIHKNGTFHYSIIQGFFWMAYCAGTVILATGIRKITGGLSSI